MHFDRDFFAHYLAEHFYTYEDFADLMGATKTTVYRWASGRSEPSKRNVRKMAEVMGVDPMLLMAEDEGVPLQPNKYERMR